MTPQFSGGTQGAHYGCEVVNRSSTYLTVRVGRIRPEPMRVAEATFNMHNATQPPSVALEPGVPAGVEASMRADIKALAAEIRKQALAQPVAP